MGYYKKYKDLTAEERDEKARELIERANALSITPDGPDGTNIYIKNREKFDSDDFDIVFDYEMRTAGKGKLGVSAFIATCIMSNKIKSSNFASDMESREEAEKDIFQEAYITIYNAINRYDPEKGNIVSFANNHIRGTSRARREKLDGSDKRPVKFVQIDAENDDENEYGYDHITHEEAVTLNSYYEGTDTYNDVENIIEKGFDRKRKYLIDHILGYSANGTEEISQSSKITNTEYAFFRKFLGGFENWGEPLQDYLCDNISTIPYEDINPSVKNKRGRKSKKEIEERNEAIASYLDEIETDDFDRDDFGGI